MARDQPTLRRREFVAGSLAAPLSAAAVAPADGTSVGERSAVGQRAADVRRDVSTAVAAAASAQPAGSPPTLEGDVTTAPVPFEGGVLVGTDRGVYVVTDGSIEAFVRTQPVRDVVHVGGAVAVALLDDENFASVVGIDTSTGERTWEYGPSRTVYSRDFGQVERTVPGFDAAPIGDSGGDGATDVAVAVGSRIVALDGSTGDPLWTADRAGIVWQIAVVDGTVCGGTRGGYVVGLDAGDGSEAFEQQVATPFEHDRIGAVARSVWSVEPVAVDGTDRLAVSTEDGAVALVNPTDGTVVWREQVVSFDAETLRDYYGQGRLGGEPTVPGDSQFFNLELTVAERDGGPMLGVAVFVDRRAAGRVYELGRQELYGVDAASGSVAWSNEGVSLRQVGDVAFSSGVAGGSFLLPSAPGQRTQTVATYAVGDGAERDPLEVPSVPGARRGGNRATEGYVATRDGQVVVASTAGDLSVVSADGSVAWSVPSLRDGTVVTGDFLGDGTEDTLVVSQNRVQGEVQHRTLVLRSGSDGSVAWSRVQGAPAFFDDGGFVYLRTLERRDGGRDLVGVRRRPRRDGSDQRPLSTLVYLSGADGSELAGYDLVNDETHALDRSDQRFGVISLAVVGDVTGSGTPDVLVGTRDRAFVLDVGTGDVVWERLSRETPPDSDAQRWRPIDANDVRYRAVGGEGDLQSLVAFSRETGRSALVEPDASGDGLSYAVARTTDFGEIARPTVTVVPDRNGDGYDEVVLDRRADESAERVVFSPGDGSVVETLRRAGTASVTPVALGSGDGRRPGMATYREEEGQSTAAVYDGFERVWSHRFGNSGPVRQLGVDRPVPATPAGDVDGDGQTEIAVVKSSPRSGAKVELRDLATDELVDEVVLEPFEEVGRNPIPGAHVQQIPDQTGDGVPELGVVAVTDGSSSRRASFYVVDPADGTVLASGRDAVTRFAVFEDGLGLLADDGTLTSVDPSAGVSLSASASGSSLDLSWEFDAEGPYVTTVRVDGRLVDRTTAQSTTLRLPPGTFTVQVAATDPDGITAYDSRSLTVDATSSLNLALYGATTIAVGALFGIGFLPAVRRRVGR